MTDTNLMPKDIETKAVVSGKSAEALLDEYDS